MITPEQLKKFEDSLSPTERRLFDVLRTGKGYTKAELITRCFDDGLTSESNLLTYISKLRCKAKILGLDIYGRKQGKYNPLEYHLVFPASI